MHEYNDHLLAGAWWVTLKSPDLLYFFYPWTTLQILKDVLFTSLLNQKGQ